jgi:hypothetical protein
MKEPRLTRAKVAILAGSIMTLLFGCTNLKDYQGEWTGSIHADEAVRAGFSEHTEMTLNIEHANTRALVGTVTTCVRDPQSQECQPGRFQDSELIPLQKAQNDDLKSLTYGGEPYAVYVMTLQPVDPQQPEVLALVSLHASARVEVRLLRGQQLYGVFRLASPEEL